MPKRSKSEILLSILKLCVSGSSKTRIVYQCNLNFRTGSIHLSQAIEKGFISLDGKRYLTTPKGVEMIKNLERIKEFL